MICAIEWIKSSVEVLLLENILIKDIIWKTKNSVSFENFSIWGYNFCRLSPTGKQLLEKIYFKFLHALCTWHKEAISYRSNIVTFRHNFAYMVNSFVVSLDITVLINILQEITKILKEKMLYAINLYWLHNNATDKIIYSMVTTMNSE